MKKNKRYESLDILRGIAIILIVFFHTSVYNFANIHKIDFSNPPISVVLISFLVLWGGLLIFYSGIVNAIMISRRIEKDNKFTSIKHLIIGSGIYLIIHYLLNIVFGRWSNDFVNNQPHMTFVAQSIRNLDFSFPHITKLFEGSSISTIAFNLIFISILLYFILRKQGIKNEKKSYFTLFIIGSILMIISFVRVNLYHVLDLAINSKNYLLATIYSYTIANPYPLLPYLAYGLFGAMIGLMIHNKRRDLLKKVMLPISLFFIIFGIIGSMNFEKSISNPDFFWYFKTQLELGIFILFSSLSFLLFEKNKKLTNKLQIVKWFSKVSLTVYMLETLVSEIFRKVLDLTIPMWNQTINNCLIFGAINVLIWIVILFFWSKSNFVYSLEYFWVKLFKKLGKKSTKLQKN